MTGGAPHLSHLNSLGGGGSATQHAQAGTWSPRSAQWVTVASLPMPPRAIPPMPPRAIPRWLRPDPQLPNTLGWRAWLWSEQHQCLVSPHQATPWPTPLLTAAEWNAEEALRGSAGIHARLVPRHWKIVGWPDDDSSNGLDENPFLVTGVAERFGHYVLGTEGWRAQQVVIRELLAPSTKIGLFLEQLYPDVIVHYSDQEEETPCESVKSSELERGSRSLLPSSPALSQSLPHNWNPVPPAPTPLYFPSPRQSLLDRFFGIKRP